MADDVTVDNGALADYTVSADDASGKMVQRVKLAYSADGSATHVPADADGLLVNLGANNDIALPSYMVDTFGKLQTVNCINDIDVQFFRDVPANLVTVTAASGGTATRTNGLMQLATSSASTGEIRAVSLDNVLYRSGGEIYCLITAAWLTGGVASSSQRIGLYDNNNGFFIGYEGTTFGVTSRTGASDTQVAKANFNVDTLVGGAGSKFTRAGTPEAIDLTKLNVFRIRFGWLGAAPIKFEVLSPDGEWVLFHVIRQPNLSANPSIQSVDLPVTAHLVKTTGGTDIQFNTACWGAGTTYDKVDIIGSNTLSTASNSVVSYNVQGVGTLQVRVGTTTTGSIIFEATIDGTNWITHPACWLLGAAGSADTLITAAVTPTSGNSYRLQCAGFRAIRVRVTSTLGATVILHAQGDSKATIINTVQVDTIATTMNASSSDGATALTNTAQAIKAAAGTLLGYYIYNPNATAAFVQFYNTASGSVTVGTTNPLFMLTIPPGTAANLWMGKDGPFFSTAMSWAAVSTAGGNGALTTALDAIAWYK